MEIKNTMEAVTVDVRQLIEEALPKATSYKEYKILVEALAKQGLSTGNEQTASLANYTKLNDRRMKRLDKTVKLTDEMIEKAKAYTRNVTWLVLTESWCGDAAQTMPVMEKFAELSKNIDFNVLLRDEHMALMDQFLTNGSRSIPKLIAFDTDTKEVIGEFGPRPSAAIKMVEEYKAAHGKLTPEFKQDLQIWYNKDKGQNTAADLLKLLK